MQTQLEQHISLRNVYQEWLHTQNLLQILQKQITTLQPFQVQVVMENVVMYRLLHDDQPTPSRLFTSIDAEAIRQGLDAIGAPQAPEEIAKFLAVLQQPWPEYKKTERPLVELTETELRCGLFRQPLVAPIQRLLKVAFMLYQPQTALQHVACCALRYASIYAKTRHIGPPQGVYDDFYSWGVRNEGFASPFNARLLGKTDCQFFSAFVDTDAVFGSKGSLFNAHWSDHDGSWSLDPPFLPETMQRTMNKIRQWRSEEYCPAILLIVPASFTLDYAPDETVRLTAGHHCYTGLDGQLRPLPVDVNIHRFGTLEGFDAERIKQGYLPVSE